MILIDKKTYVNKTWKFLIPCLASHGQEFMDLFNRAFTLAAGIHDTHLKGSPITQRRVVYCLFNSNYNRDIMQKLIHYSIKSRILAYEYDTDFPLKNSNRRMLVFKIPEVHYKAYDHFLKGEYSQMYTPEFVDANWGATARSKIVLKNQEEEGLPMLVEEIKEVLDGNQSPKDMKGSELALPLIKEEEIFNCVGEQRVFFNENLDKLWQE